MYSDNGTTFAGADKELSQAYRDAQSDVNFLNFIVSDNITWSFIPPHAPHFGGLWEAGVKSVKYHLRRILGNHTLTFEELTTVLCKVEACLNSRPLCPLTDSIDDFEVLTPGHFLIGSAITINPEPSVLQINENRLSRWQLLRQITERFGSIGTPTILTRFNSELSGERQSHYPYRFHGSDSKSSSSSLQMGTRTRNPLSTRL
ncbi:uncharacterized protein LOC114935485 [Nylanderia fulva]|uniref:uncharacterized protein LOC114935485 n=1 Tax=Nylanderia fulva TaxID=613905 RepID=UPI0010FB4824|nr:uncharacterized protein LOC114935485 [Nylanderia fulva]